MSGGKNKNNASSLEHSGLTTEVNQEVKQVQMRKQLKGPVNHRGSMAKEEGTHHHRQGNHDLSLPSLPQIISPQVCCRIAE